MEIKIVNGIVFVNGCITTDPELIGYSILDFAEQTKDDFTSIELKEGDVFIDN